MTAVRSKAKRVLAIKATKIFVSKLKRTINATATERNPTMKIAKTAGPSPLSDVLYSNPQLRQDLWSDKKP